MFEISVKAGSKFMEVAFLLGVFRVFFLVLFTGYVSMSLIGFKIFSKVDKPKDIKKIKKDKKLE